MIGLAELLRKQNQLVALMRGSEIEKDLEKALKPIEGRAKQLVSVRSGNLQRSIGTEVARESNSVVVGRVGSNEPYARRQELGFVGLDSLGRRYDQHGRPYLMPAAISEEGKVLDLMAKGSSNKIERIAR